MPSPNQQIYCLKSNLWENIHDLPVVDPHTNIEEWVINVTRKKVLMDLIFLFDLCKRGKPEVVKHYLQRISKRMKLNIYQMYKCKNVSKDNRKMHEEYYKSMLNNLCIIVVKIRLKE